MKLIDSISESNPQLFRELKGKSTPRNLLIVASLSLIGQLFIYLYHTSFLPANPGMIGQYNRYCAGGGDGYCFTGLLNQIMIIHELWWLDLFTSLSVLGIFLLLVGGTYLLVSDLTTETKQGTLNFIRLSPQRSTNVLWGKLLGVPSLIILATGLALPLHLIAGLKAVIPLGLILSFYLVVAASCLFCWSMALLYSLVTTALGSFQPWLASGVCFIFLFFCAAATLSSYFEPTYSAFDWLVVFYPGTFLHYLVNSTFLASDSVKYLELENWRQLSWYGTNLFNHWLGGLSFVLFNYSLWTYWIWQGLTRRFASSNTTVISKQQSHWLTFSFIVISLGFTLQIQSDSDLLEQFAILQLFNLSFFLILLVTLTPAGQTLKDWARYRHRQGKSERKLFTDLLVGEKSPSILVIALNLAITLLYIIPSVFLFAKSSDYWSILVGWVLSSNMILVFTVVAQLIMIWQSRRPGVWSLATVSGLMFAPLLVLMLFHSNPHDGFWLWSFSILPTVAVESITSINLLFSFLAQGLLITALNLAMGRKLQQVGASETKSLLSSQL